MDAFLVNFSLYGVKKEVIRETRVGNKVIIRGASKFIKYALNMHQTVNQCMVMRALNQY